MRIRTPIPLLTLFAIICCIMSAPCVLFAAGEPVESTPSLAGFAKGWTVDGNVNRYTRENLYTHIDGEAELYMPYGFSGLESVLYKKMDNPKVALQADIFRMGSPIDAFGVYSYYRDPDSETVNIGAEGFIDDSQLMFYKDLYFVHLAASGDNPDRADFLACAEAIARRLPGGSATPRELDLIKFPGVLPHTEKYTAQSVLGYAFFKKGLTAEAVLAGRPVKMFVILDGSDKEAADTFNRYAAYLKEKGGAPRIVKSEEAATLVGSDPLYKGVLVRLSGRHVFGITDLASAP
ncbi:MAG TPA: DUF6599 family protein [Syntrophorhabdaceae bacterium]|nr:DUF6599 family protein [Syntrophorhabdaceae bacterium]